MSGFAEIASSMLVSAQDRLDVVSLNVSNLNTPGFRARKAFQHTLDARHPLPTIATVPTGAGAAAALKATGNPLDIAITGGGYMLLRAGDRLIPAVSVQLHRDADGRLVDAAGRLLQSAGGGDVSVSSGRPVVLKDGTLLVDGQAEARIGAFTASDAGGGIAGLPDEAPGAVLHQGMVVPSNVNLGTEMVEMTRAARTAETGGRLFQVYDDLIGRVATKLGEVGR